LLYRYNYHRHSVLSVSLSVADTVKSLAIVPGHI